MQKSKFGILANYFHYNQFEINKKDNSKLLEKVKEYYNDVYQNYKYATCLIETETNDILYVSCLTNIDNLNVKRFGFYLDQLPNLELNTVSMLLAFSSQSNSTLLNDIFQIPENYPSDFCRMYLKDTFGRVVFTFQFMELLSFCLASEENNTKQITEYKRLFNQRNSSFFEKLNSLYLPDGYSLYKLLKKHTPFESDSTDFGFVTHAKQDIAYKFIKRANKYL